MEFQAILNQQVKARTTHFVAEIEWLSAEMVELRQLYMEIKLNMRGTYPPRYRLYDPNEDLPPLSPPLAPLL